MELQILAMPKRNNNKNNILVTSQSYAGFCGAKMRVQKNTNMYLFLGVDGLVQNTIPKPKWHISKVVVKTNKGVLRTAASFTSLLNDFVTLIYSVHKLLAVLKRYRASTHKTMPLL